MYLSGIDPEMVQVELYADGPPGIAPDRLVMGRKVPLAGVANAFVYAAPTPTSRPVTDYTARVIPHHRGAAIPLEAPLILWAASTAKR